MAMSKQTTTDDARLERAGGPGAVLLAGHRALGELPLWAQVLVAARLLQRAALALQAEWPVELRELIDQVIAAMQDCARDGGHVHLRRALFDRAMAQRDVDAATQTAPIRGMLWYAIDATRAADAAQDFPIDATVTQSTLGALRELVADARVTPLQLLVLLAGDIDQLRYACDEARVDRYVALPAHVFLRLAPVHALTLVEACHEAPSSR
jgi:hypothetical protein